MVLIDSSVWIEYWRRADSGVSLKLKGLIRDKKICINGLILTEILQGARDRDEMEYLKTILADIPRLPLDEETFLKAAEISFKLKRSGKTLGTVDALIAASALMGKASLYTLDRHFRMVPEAAPLKLFK